MVWEIVPFDPQTPPSDKSKSTKVTSPFLSLSFSFAQLLSQDSLLQLTKEEFQANAVKRLMRDLGEVKRCPIHNISALPLEDNIMEWHCNMGGPASSPYAGTLSFFPPFSFLSFPSSLFSTPLSRYLFSSHLYMHL